MTARRVNPAAGRGRSDCGGGVGGDRSATGAWTRSPREEGVFSPAPVGTGVVSGMGSSGRDGDSRRGCAGVWIRSSHFLATSTIRIRPDCRRAATVPCGRGPRPTQGLAVHPALVRRRPMPNRRRYTEDGQNDREHRDFEPWRSSPSHASCPVGSLRTCRFSRCSTSCRVKKLADRRSAPRESRGSCEGQVRADCMKIASDRRRSCPRRSRSRGRPAGACGS